MRTIIKVDLIKKFILHSSASTVQTDWTQDAGVYMLSKADKRR